MSNQNPTGRPGEDRGQVGIDTLVLFISLILVAAVSAGVLITTVEFLQDDPSSTNELGEPRVPDRVVVIGATGTVNASTDPNVVNGTELSVMRSPGAEDIDLSAATIRWVGPDGTTTLPYGDVSVSRADESAFTVTATEDDDDSVPVLTSKYDRFHIRITHTGQGSEVLTPLNGGEEVTLRIVTQSGSTYVYVLHVPESLGAKSDGEAVEM